MNKITLNTSVTSSFQKSLRLDKFYHSQYNIHCGLQTQKVLRERDLINNLGPQNPQDDVY